MIPQSDVTQTSPVINVSRPPTLVIDLSGVDVSLMVKLPAIPTPTIATIPDGNVGQHPVAVFDAKWTWSMLGFDEAVPHVRYHTTCQNVHFRINPTPAFTKATLPREQVPYWRHAPGARYGRPRRADAWAHARRHARAVVVVVVEAATRLVLEAERRHVVAHELVGRHAHVQHGVAALQLEVPAVEARARRQHLGARVDAQRDHLAVEAAELHLQTLGGELDPLVRQQPVLVGRLQLLDTGTSRAS